MSRVLSKMGKLISFFVFIQYFSLGCSSGFVAFHIKNTKGSGGGEAPVPVENGYLRFHISTELSGLKLPAPGDKFSYLAISLENPSGVEFPIFLYDFTKANQSSVEHFDIGNAAYTNLLSSNEASFAIHARVIPQRFAAVYAKNIESFKSVIKQLPVAEISDAHPEVAVAAGVLSALSDIIEKEGNKVWSTHKVIGLSSGEGGGLPVYGNPVIVFLLPEKEIRDQKKMKLITDTDFEVCAESATRSQICRVGETKPFTEVPYFLLTVNLTDYRPLGDLAPAVSCDRTESDLNAIEEAFRKNQFTEEQRKHERIVIDELGILVNLKKNSKLTIDELAYNINKLNIESDEKHSDYWNRHYKETSTQLHSCIEKEIVTRGLKERVWYDVIRRAIGASFRWEDDYTKAQNENKPEEEVVHLLEDALLDITTPIVKFNLSTGEVYNFLTMQKNHIESKLRVHDEQLRKAVHLGNNAESEAYLRQIFERLSKTSCETCKPILEAAYSDLKTVQAQNKLEATQANLMRREEEFASLKMELASLRNEAYTLINLVKNKSMQDEQLAMQLKQAYDKTQSLTVSEDASQESIHGAIEEIKTSMQPLKDKISMMSAGE